MIDLSIVIPARNEEFLGITVKNLLENIEGNTEILVGLDGYDKPIPDIPQDSRVKVVKVDVSIGQRAMTNRLVAMSNAHYIVKVDAHCTFGKGFDRILMEDMQEDWTLVPTMRNLHAFDWVCEKCGNSWYQGPTPTHCMKDYKHPVINPDCDSTSFKRKIVWEPRRGTRNNFYRFDKDLHFQYWRDFEDRLDPSWEVAETMSIQGSFFMITRAKYLELNICDEAHGSWGQQGVEVACKTWLSGGKVMTSKKTWYSHLFRTQGGDFGFPYENNTVTQARKFSQDLWNSPFEELKKKFPQAVHDLKWLLDKFAPVPDWEFTKGILYYSDCKKEEWQVKPFRDLLKRANHDRYRIVSVTLKPLSFGDNITLPLERSFLTMAKQILTGLKELNTDYVFFCEDDVAYSSSHFDFVPPTRDTYYYNMNCWQVRDTDGYAVYFDAKRLSQICADRKLLIAHYEKRIKLIEEAGERGEIIGSGFAAKMGYEPGTHHRPERVDDLKAEGWRSEVPNLDVATSSGLNSGHGSGGKTLTNRKWRPEDFRSQKNCQNWKVAENGEIPGWSKEDLESILQKQ